MSNKKNEAIVVDGIVKVVYPGCHFAVELEGGVEVRAYISGKMRENFVKIIVGDRVSVELTSYDLTKGRIIFRYK